MTTTIAMIESTAVVTLALLMLAVVGDRVRTSFWLRSFAVGAAFAFAGAISMASPVELKPGFYVDARSVVMALSSAVSGPVSALITGSVLSVVRYNAGGEGVAGGIASLWLAAVPGVLIWIFIRGNGARELAYRHIILLASTAALMPLFSIYFFTWERDTELSYSIAETVMPTTFFGVLLLGVLIVGDVQRRWALRAHAEGRAQIQAIASNAPCVLFQFFLREDQIAEFLYVSEGAERILGVPADDIVSKPGTIGQLLDTPSLELFRQRVRESAETMMPWTLDLEFHIPDGRTAWMRVAAAPRVGVEGRVVWDGSLVDVTEQKEIENMKTDFVSTVSHELRTPLTSIRGSLGLVAGGAAGELPEKAANLIRIALSNCERLVRLINDILDIEKIDSGRMPFDVKPHRLHDLVATAIEAGNGYLSERGVSVVLVDKAPDVTINVDADRMHQVVTNLLSNAIKFSQQDGEVTVRIERHADTVRISVCDRGPGIPDEFRERIFGRFEQADSSGTRKQGGTGLGLAISKSIVDRLGGRISFDSEIGIGTSFHVDLPFAAPERAEPSPCEAQSRAIGDRMLICEDEPDVAAVIAAMLRDEGIESDVAPNVTAASDLLSRNEYLALTLDIRLAGESGISLLQQLRAADRYRDLPVIVISGYIDEERNRFNGSAVGIVDWLKKPIDMDRLRAAVRKVRQARHPDKPSVLHVEDDEDVLQVISMALGDEVDVTFARSCGEAKDALRKRDFDVVILDLDLPDGWGADLMGEIPPRSAIVVFSATEIEEKLADRVQAAMTKTRMSEIDLADIVRRLTDERAGEEAQLDAVGMMEGRNG